MVVVEIVLLVLLVVIVKIVSSGREGEKEVERWALEGAVVTQLGIIGQWAMMGGEVVDNVEGYRWLGGIQGEIGEIVIMVDGISIWLLLLTG